MTNPCVVNTLGIEENEITRNIVIGDWERCEYCKCVFIWSMLPDEKVIKDRQPSEFWGATVYETIVVGFVCPECGYKTTF